MRLSLGQRWGSGSRFAPGSRAGVGPVRSLGEGCFGPPGSLGGWGGGGAGTRVHSSVQGCVLRQRDRPLLGFILCAEMLPLTPEGRGRHRPRPHRRHVQLVWRKRCGRVCVSFLKCKTSNRFCVHRFGEASISAGKARWRGKRRWCSWGW